MNSSESSSSASSAITASYSLDNRNTRVAEHFGATRRNPKLSSAIPEIWPLIRPFRWLISGCFALMIVNRACALVVPVAFRYLINDVMYAHRFEKLSLIVAAVVGATCVQGITDFLLSQNLNITGQLLIADLRKRVQQHVGSLPISFYDRSRAGDLAARIMNDVEGVRDLVGPGILDLVGGMMTAIIALALLLRISVSMTALTFCIVVSFSFFLKKVFGITRPLFRERSKLMAEVSGRLAESLAAVRIVKSYHAEGGEANAFSKGVENIRKNYVSSIRAQSWLSLASAVLFGIVGGLVMYLGALEVKGHRLDIGSYVEFIALLAFMVTPISLMVSVGSQLTESIAKLDRTVALLQEPEEGRETCRTQTIGAIDGRVIFRDVSFAYTQGKTVLHEVGFEANPGTITAVVGASGAGKSTVISLICGFYTPLDGQIFIDGVDLSTIKLSSYRQQLGAVLQDTFLFAGTIRENVLFSRPDASRDQWVEVCRIARVDEFAERLPQQYETIVGERGIRLSGGQRQRIAIARAILADPRILILDEATSSLDSDSEALIQQGLTSLMRGRTSFVIAHRLSTIRSADQILVLDHGRIIERGTHESLYRLQRRYYDFYVRQYGIEPDLRSAARVKTVSEWGI